MVRKMKKTKIGAMLFALLLCVLLVLPLAACGPGTDPEQYTVTVNGGTGGGTYDSGESCTVTATVPAGKVFVNWTSETVEVSTANPYTFTVTKTIMLTANFKDETPAVTQYTVTVNGGTGGGTYDSGAFCTATATVPAGKLFVNWTSGTTVMSTANPYTFTVTGNVALTANFEDETPAVTQYTVTVNGGTGGGTYDSGASCTATATVPTGKVFVNWTSGTTEVSTANPYIFTVTGNIMLTANFEDETPETQYTVTVNGGTGGGSYITGASCTVTATVPEGQYFLNWTSGAVAVSTDNPYTFTVNGNITLTANLDTIAAVSLEIGKPDKIDYEVGDVFDPTGMTVNVKYNDGGKEEITDYQVDEGALTVSDKYVTVTRGELSKKVAVKVSDPAAGQRFEAEAATLSNTGVARYGNDDNNPTDPSGTGYLANWGSATVTFTISSDKDATADLYFCGGGMGANSTTTIASRLNSLSVNDTVYAVDASASITTVGGTAYFNWTKVLIVENIELTEGINTIAFAAKDTMNFDYIELDTDAALCWTDEAEDGHSYTDWVFLTEPTEYTQGEIFRYCTVCKKTETVIVPELTECTLVSEAAATEAIRGIEIYRFTDWWDEEFTFTLTAGAATGEAQTTRIQIEDVPKAAYPCGNLASVEPHAGDDTNGGKLVGLNNAGGLFTFEFTADQAATVTLYIRISRVTSRTYYPFKNMAFDLNGKEICVDPTAVVAPRTEGTNWYSWVDVKVAVFEVEQGENTLKLISRGSRFTNIDDIRMDSVASLIWTGGEA